MTSNTHDAAVANCVGILGATFGVEADALLIEAYSLGLSGLVASEIEYATGVAIQRCKWMPKPAELIEFSRTRGVSCEAQAAIAFEELDSALARNQPETMSPIVAALCRQLGGFHHLRTNTSNSEFYVWKKKEFLAAFISLSRENPERLLAISGEQSEIVKALRLKQIESREQLKQREEANRQKLLEALE